MTQEFSKFVAEFSKTCISLDPGFYLSVFHASRSALPVLIMGPSGTGKELVASAVSEMGERRAGKFRAVNCALYPKDMLYAELFGYTKGAFTGASKDSEGVFLEANEGTIFLDEIGDLPEDAQAGLLRVLEDGEIRPLGWGEDPKKVDVRVIAATNRELTNKDSFRNELFQRLRVFPIYLQPLRPDRSWEIPYLLKHILEQANVSKVDFHFYAFCLTNTWEGNVRELKNYCRYAIAHMNDGRLSLSEHGDGFYRTHRHLDSATIGYFDNKSLATAESSPHPVTPSDFCNLHEVLFPALTLHSDEITNYYNFLRNLLGSKKPRNLKKEFGVTFKVRKSQPVTGHSSQRYPEFSFPDVSTSALPTVSATSLDGLLPHDYGYPDTEEGRFVRDLTNSILTANWSRVPDLSRTLRSASSIPKYQDHERSYWEEVFRRYPDQSLNWIAQNVAGVSQTRVKRKRDKYSSKR